jgi:hypothetical protein
MCENTSQRITEERSKRKIISAEMTWKKGRIKRERKRCNYRRKEREIDSVKTVRRRLKEPRIFSAFYSIVDKKFTAIFLCFLQTCRFWSRGNLVPYSLHHCLSWLYLYFWRNTGLAMQLASVPLCLDQRNEQGTLQVQQTVLPNVLSCTAQLTSQGTLNTDCTATEPISKHSDGPSHSC